MSTRVPIISVLVPIVCLSAAIASAQPPVPSFQRDDHAATLNARGIASADFNRDGWLDLVTANHGPHGIAILLSGAAAGGFSQSFIPIDGGPFDVETGDLNNDGVPDIAVAAPDSNRIVVVFGNPAGGFGAPATVAAANSRGLTIADMDGDGNLDLIYTHWDRGAVQMLHGNGRGQFASRVPALAVGINPQGVAAADFDLDGRMDLAVASSGSVGISILRQTSPDVFARSDVAGLQTSQNVIVAADLNRDGRPDIAAASTGTNAVTVHLFRGTSTTTQVIQTDGSSVRGIDAADLNRDGAVDIVIAARGTSTAQVLLFGHPDSGSFAPPPVGFAAGAGSRAVAIADFDNDGRPDIATANEFSPSVTVLSNTTVHPRSAFAFRGETIGTETNELNGDATADVADFDQDGRLDVVTHGPGNVVRVMHAAGAPRDLPAPPQGPREVRAVNFNGDGFADILYLTSRTRDTETMQIAAYPGQGAAGFGALRTTETGIAAFEMETGDLNRDGKLDVVVGGRTTEAFQTRVLVYHGRGDGTFALASTLTTGLTFRRVAIGDVDRDGDDDIVTSRSGGFPGSGTSVTVWPNDGTGRFGALGQSVDVPGFDGINGGDLGDINHDGWLDFVAGGFGRPSTRPDNGVVLLGGPAGLGTPSTMEMENADLVLRDMTLDGHLDVINGAGEILPGNGDGTFARPQAFAARIFRARVTDVDRDGLPDIVAGRERNGTALVMFNLRRDDNTAPTVEAGRDFTIQYGYQFGDGDLELFAEGSDADFHALTFEWRDEAGNAFGGTDGDARPPLMLPGTHRFAVTVSDNRGGIATGSVTITVLPEKEVVTHVGALFDAEANGNWSIQPDSTAAGGRVLRDTQANLPKVTAPSANPSGYVDLFVVVDPTQTYKLWVRLKADQDHWTNDSLWLQFDNAVDQNGRTFAPGTTSGIEVVLEECSGCGETGWGWRDDAWGQRGATSALTLKFTRGGHQRVRIQTREDGVSIDQLVLSAEQFRTTRPGTVKNDTRIVPATSRY